MLQGLRRPITDILKDRSNARRAKVRPQVDALLACLRLHGVACEAIGSYARQSAVFDQASDVDILIESLGDLSQLEIWDLAWKKLTDSDVDLVFAEDLTPQKVSLMKEHALG